MKIKKPSQWIGIITLAWIAFLIWSSVQPYSRFRFFLQHGITSDQFHVGAYGVLAFLFAICFRSFESVPFFEKRAVAITLFASLFCLGFGGFTESLQLFVKSRTADWQDFDFDVMGAILGVASFWIFSKVLEYFQPRRLLNRDLIKSFR